MTSIRKLANVRLAWPVLIALLMGQGVDGQNLVPNPSFEDINMCAEFSQPCSPSAWFYLSRKLTTGYFPRFSSATGERHLQLVAASRESVNRQYWETMLLCPLQAGERYVVSLKIASPGSKQGELNVKIPNLRDIGFWFTNRFVFVQGDSLLQPAGYLSFPGATTKDLKNGWFEIRKEFVPTRSSSILIVGNFVRADNADILEQRAWPGPSIDILVDDISISAVKGSGCANAGRVKDSLYAIHWRLSDNVPGYDGNDSLVGRGTDTAGLTPGKALPEQPRPVTPPPTVGPPTGAVPVTPNTDTIVLRNIQFDFDKYLMQNPDTLQRYRSLFTKPGVKKIRVVGFTDDTGSEAYNLDLSQKRAREIGRLLIGKFNLAPGLIEMEGKGISRTFPTKDLNRRVEIYIFHE
jgi:outer membrane protein OmpA-like peptidoglycan-associated protein